MFWFVVGLVLGVMIGSLSLALVAGSSDTEKKHKEGIDWYKAYLSDCWEEINRLREEKE